jgi:hypothetical protein
MGRKQGQEARKGRIEGRLKEAQEEKGKGEGRNGGKETKITGSEAEAEEMRKGKKGRKQRTKKSREARRSKKKHRTGTTNTAMPSPLAGNRKHHSGNRKHPRAPNTPFREQQTRIWELKTPQPGN